MPVFARLMLDTQRNVAPDANDQLDMDGNDQPEEDEIDRPEADENPPPPYAPGFLRRALLGRDGLHEHERFNVIRHVGVQPNRLYDQLVGRSDTS